jgi:urease beta subunit
MRSSLWTLVFLAVSAPVPALAGTDLRIVDDPAWCREDGGNDGARHCEVREAVLPAGGLLGVDARPNGGIEVHGWDRGEARLRVKIVANADSEAAARELAGQVRVDTAGTVRAVGPERRRGHGWYASYRLDVPRRAQVRLQADNGGLHVADFAGDAELHTVNGGLHLAQVGGHVHGETVNGGVHMELSGTGWQGEGLELRTTNGGLHLEIPAGYNARLEMGTVNGGVDSDLPLTTHGHHTGGRIETTLGQGGPLLRVETTNGGLHVRRR